VAAPAADRLPFDHAVTGLRRRAADALVSALCAGAIEAIPMHRRGDGKPE
jgi:hypothetical protein